jgi:pimeloyl-ACP methyl ester carboxylesterase
MGIGKVALVGHDLGALVALSFIRQLPQSVDRVMAINCPLEYETLPSRMKTDSPSALVDWLSSRTPESLSALSDVSKTDPKAVTVSMESFQANNLFGSVRDLNVPCLFVYGGSNPAVPLPSSEKFSLPMHMHQIVLDGVGHFPMLDNPQQFNRLLTDFLALESGLSPRELQLKEEWKRRVR